jgi:hypothetical protein
MPNIAYIKMAVHSVKIIEILNTPSRGARKDGRVRPKMDAALKINNYRVRINTR